MEIFLYKRDGDYLIPSQEGEIRVLVDNFVVRAYTEDGTEIKPKFKLFGKEISLLNRLRELEKETGIEIDENVALAYPDLKSRIVKLNQLMGFVFEEFVFLTLSKYFKVKRNYSKVASLPKLGLSIHNKPDILVEDKIVVEAKVGDYDRKQILDYEKQYPYGLVVFPWSGECKTGKWPCFYYFLKDHERVIKYILSLLNQVK